VGIEFAVAALGAVVLAWRRRGELTPVWVALVVGVHFFPLARLLQNTLLYAVAVTVVAVAVAAIPMVRSHELAPSAVTGVGTGCVLLVAAAFSLAGVVR
jgi:hypothetical protein